MVVHKLFNRSICSIGGEGGDGLSANIRIGGNSEHLDLVVEVGWFCYVCLIAVSTTPGDMGQHLDVVKTEW